mmetsp:Transcript_23011/g.58017  ORF Transcript_23011/g.58017 Transcript_23011/m.58017 type:complete len:241 (+) Transcript_23011:570-1292(+)
MHRPVGLAHVLVAADAILKRGVEVEGALLPLAQFRVACAGDAQLIVGQQLGQPAGTDERDRVLLGERHTKVQVAHEDDVVVARAEARGASPVAIPPMPSDEMPPSLPRHDHAGVPGGRRELQAPADLRDVLHAPLARGLPLPGGQVRAEPADPRVEDAHPDRGASFVAQEAPKPGGHAGDLDAPDGGQNGLVGPDREVHSHQLLARDQVVLHRRGRLGGGRRVRVDRVFPRSVRVEPSVD